MSQEFRNLRPWVEYFLGVLVVAYNDFAARVGTISSAKGAKRVLVKNAIAHLPPRFTIGEQTRVCKGISRRTLVRALYDLRFEGVLRCVGRGPSAQREGCSADIINMPRKRVVASLMCQPPSTQ